MAVSVFVREYLLLTNVYVDGFNLYYRALKDTPFRWLDLRKLAETLRSQFPDTLTDDVGVIAKPPGW